MRCSAHTIRELTLLLLLGFLLPHSAACAPAPDRWPMFRGEPALTGVAAGSLPSELALLWKFKTGGPVKSSAALENGRVYIGSDDGQLYALQLSDGHKLWTCKTEGSVESSPLVLSNRVFVGSTDGFLYCVDAADGALRRWAVGWDDPP